jgi:hypothetical protein
VPMERLRASPVIAHTIAAQSCRVGSSDTNDRSILILSKGNTRR